ncbi:MAG: ABC transporter permease [Methylococcales bacterium]
MAFQRFLPLVSLISLIALWQITAVMIQSPVLPTPIKVIQVLIDATVSGDLPYNLGITLARLTASFFLAMLLGSAIGIVLGRHRTLDQFFDNWIIILLNIPALVTIILCFVWFGLIESAAVLAVVINKLPNVVVTIREGTRVLDRNLLEMAQSYNFSRYKTFRHVIWPQLYPFVITSARTGLALIWKIILVVEMLGRSDGMGYQLHLYFQLFDVAGILAYTITFILIIQLIELLILKPLDRHARRWRR